MERIMNWDLSRRSVYKWHFWMLRENGQLHQKLITLGRFIKTYYADPSSTRKEFYSQ